MAVRIAVVGGGTGYIGRHVCRALEYNGYIVKIISRSARYKDDLTWHEVQELGLPYGTYAVFNFAGEPVLNRRKQWTKDFEKEVYRSRVHTTALLRDAIINSENLPKFWGSCTGTEYYPPSKVITYDEFTRVDAKERDYWSKFSRKWENAATLPQYLEHEVRHVALRTAMVIGRGGGALARMYPSFYMGMGGRIGKGKQFFPWIHLEDLVNLWIYALSMRNMRGVYNAVSPDTITNDHFATTFGTVLHKPAAIKLPKFAVELTYGDVRSALLLEGQAVKPKKTLASGFRFEYDEIYSALKAPI